MEMFLMALCITVFGMGVAAAAFGAATRSEPDAPERPQPQLPLAKAIAPTRFFSDTVPAPPVIPTKQVPIEVLLLQIENHVRMEQAAAELFIASPTQSQLHSKTNSPFVN